MLKKLNISASGYYGHFKSEPSKSKQRKNRLTKEIKDIYEKSYRIYGSPKITAILQKNGETVSQKYVYTIMKENSLKARYIKPYTITTTGQDFSAKLENLLNRHFNPAKPDTAWCSDITYIWTYDDGFVYLTSIMDLYSRSIISWVLTKTLDAQSVLKCVEKAKQKRHIEHPLVVHSDRGIQYTSSRYKELTAEFITSYSRKGTPWDNACIESFHSLIKREWLNHYKIRNYDHACQLIFEYIEGFYNTVRIHSHCDYLSPKEYETNYKLAKANT